MGKLAKILFHIIRLPYDVVRFLLLVFVWVIKLPFRLLEAVVVLPWLFLGWLFSLVHRSYSSPATIMRIWSDPLPGASSRYYTYVLFDAQGARVQIRLTYFQVERFVRKYSVGDVGHLKYRGSRLINWVPASTEHPIKSPDRGQKVFLSYAHEWHDEAAYVAQFLSSRGVAVWHDEKNLRVGDSLRAEVKNGITCAKYFVPFFSSEYFTSEWCMRELDTALKSNCKLLPVKVSSGELVMPPHFKRVYREKLGEPVFIDMRQREPTKLLNQLVDRIIGGE
jgi:hypothetical protein